MLAALEHQCPLDDLGVAADVVVAAGEDAHHGRTRGQTQLGPSAADDSAPAGSLMMPSDWYRSSISTQIRPSGTATSRGGAAAATA